MAKAKLPTPARGSKLMLSVGLVNVPIKLAPFVKSTSVKGTTCCPQHAVPVKSGKRICTHDGHELDETVTGFEVDGRYVIGVDRKEHRSSRDGTIELKNVIDLGAIDPAAYEKTYMVWPQDGGEEAHDLLAHAMKKSGQTLIGKTTLSTSTKAVAIRWSETYGMLLAHVLAYDEAIAVNDAKLVRDGIAARGAPDAKAVKLAEQLLAGLDSDFELGDVEDSYRVSLEAAIAAVAKGQPLPAAPTVEEPQPVSDLMAALQASVEKPKKAAAKKPRARTKKAA